MNKKMKFSIGFVAILLLKLYWSKIITLLNIERRRNNLLSIELATVVKGSNIDLHDSDLVSNYEDGPSFDIKS